MVSKLIFWNNSKNKEVLVEVVKGDFVNQIIQQQKTIMAALRALQ